MDLYGYEIQMYKYEYTNYTVCWVIAHNLLRWKRCLRWDVGHVETSLCHKHHPSSCWSVCTLKAWLGAHNERKEEKRRKKPENRRWSSRWPAQSIHKPKCKYISVPCGKARWATWTTATVLSYYGIFWSHWTPTMVLQQSDSHICLSGLFNPHNLTAQTHTNALRIYVQIYLKMLKWSNCATKQNQFHTMPTMWRA